MRIRVSVNRSVHREYRREPYGQREMVYAGEVEVTIDEMILARVVAKLAMDNKTGRTRQMNGLIKAKVVRKALVEEGEWKGH